MILKKKGEVSKKIMGIFDSAGFTKSKLGMFFLRVLSFLSGDMGGEDTLEAAGNMWTSAVKLGSDKIDIERRSTSLMEIIPRIVKGLVGGGSAVEAIIRAVAHDPSALNKLFENAIKLVRKAISNLISNGVADVVKAIGIDPESSIGKTIVDAVQGLVGEEPE